MGSSPPSPPSAPRRRCRRTRAVSRAVTDPSGRKLTRFNSYRRGASVAPLRSEEHTSELQSQSNLVCRLLLEKKKNNKAHISAAMTIYLSYEHITQNCLTNLYDFLVHHNPLPRAYRASLLEGICQRTNRIYLP